MKPRLTFRLGFWTCADPVGADPWVCGHGSTPESAYRRWSERKHGIGELFRQWQENRDARRRLRPGEAPRPDYLRNAFADAGRDRPQIDVAKLRQWLDAPPAILRPAPLTFGDGPMLEGSLVRITWDPPTRRGPAWLRRFFGLDA